jgi:hypothetical protein
VFVVPAGPALPAGERVGFISMSRSSRTAGRPLKISWSAVGTCSGARSASISTAGANARLASASCRAACRTLRTLAIAHAIAAELVGMTANTAIHASFMAPRPFCSTPTYRCIGPVDAPLREAAWVTSIDSNSAVPCHPKAIKESNVERTTAEHRPPAALRRRVPEPLRQPRVAPAPPRSFQQDHIGALPDAQRRKSAIAGDDRPLAVIP